MRNKKKEWREEEAAEFGVLPAKSVTLSKRRRAVMMKNTSWYPT
jgi:hypothetical protein